MLLKKKLLSKKHNLYLTRAFKDPLYGSCNGCKLHPCGAVMDKCIDVDKSVDITNTFTYIVL